MISQFVSKEYLIPKKIEALNKELKTARPFSYAVLEKFFNEEKLKEVLEEAKKEPFTVYDSDLYSFKQTKDLEFTKNKVLKEFYDCLNSKEFKEYLKQLTSIEALKKIDSSVFMYRDTDYLLPHDDQLEGRKIAYVINLTSLNKEDGGALEFFNKDNIVKSIIPKFNSFILFPVVANKTIHQVAEITANKERITISGWFND